MTDNFKELDAKECDKTNGGTSIYIPADLRRTIRESLLRQLKK